MSATTVASAYRCLPNPRLEQGGFSVRSVQPGDIEAIRVWRNAQMDVLRQAEPIGEDAQQAYFAREVWPALNVERPANILLAFAEGERLIGYGGLVHIAWDCRRAEVSFLLDPALAADEQAYRVRFASFLALIRRLAFEDLGFHRLWTETYVFRDAHIATLEHAGFRLEGRMRDHVVIDGRPTDSLIHGCLDND